MKSLKTIKEEYDTTLVDAVNDFRKRFGIAETEKLMNAFNDELFRQSERLKAMEWSRDNWKKKYKELKNGT